MLQNQKPIQSAQSIPPNSSTCPAPADSEYDITHDDNAFDALHKVLSNIDYFFDVMAIEELSFLNNAINDEYLKRMNRWAEDWWAEKERVQSLKERLSTIERLSSSG
jgi:hypothetical protein